jgi:hypothetical protein
MFKPIKTVSKKDLKKKFSPNSRIYSSISSLISEIALECAIESSRKNAVESDKRDVQTRCGGSSDSERALLSILIDNTESCLERLIPKGKTPEHISFFRGEPSQRGDVIPIPNPNRKFIIFI